MGTAFSRQRPRISVAMALYNGERFVKRQLESFAHQTRLPDEVVVSDDTSTDRSMEIVREFATHAPFRMKVLANAQNVGCTKNFERAIAACTGDVILMADWDDVQYPHRIVTMERALEQSPGAVMTICNADIVDEYLRPLGQTYWEAAGFSPSARVRRAMSEGRLFKSSLVTGGACTAFTANLKELLLPLPEGGPTPIYHDGFIAWTILLSGAGGVALVSEPLFAYRQHRAQRSSAGGNTYSRFGIWRERLARAKDRPPLAPLIDRLDSPVAIKYSRDDSLRRAVLQHWRARLGMSSNRIARVPAVLTELLAGRYHRFSHGFGAAAKDLLFVR